MYVFMCIYIYIYTVIYLCRCFRRLARNARCNTMSHLTFDAIFSHTSRVRRLM